MPSGAPWPKSNRTGSICSEFNFREIFHPDYDNRELPAHVYLRSVRNIAIERSWLRLKIEFGHSAIQVFEKGIDDGIYNPDLPEHLYVLSKCPYNNV